ncbi:Uncharacterised protein g7659 [Pycnogonum litorale]
MDQTTNKCHKSKSKRKRFTKKKHKQKHFRKSESDSNGLLNKMRKQHSEDEKFLESKMTASRITRNSGIFNLGRKSSTVHRINFQDDMETSARVEEDLKMIMSLADSKRSSKRIRLGDKIGQSDSEEIDVIENKVYDDRNSSCEASSSKSIIRGSLLNRSKHESTKLNASMSVKSSTSETSGISSGNFSISPCMEEIADRMDDVISADNDLLFPDRNLLKSLKEELKLMYITSRKDAKTGSDVDSEIENSKPDVPSGGDGGDHVTRRRSPPATSEEKTTRDKNPPNVDDVLMSAGCRLAEDDVDSFDFNPVLTTIVGDKKEQSGRTAPSVEGKINETLNVRRPSCRHVTDDDAGESIRLRRPVVDERLGWSSIVDGANHSRKSSRIGNGPFDGTAEEWIDIATRSKGTEFDDDRPLGGGWIDSDRDEIESLLELEIDHHMLLGLLSPRNDTDSINGDAADEYRSFDDYRCIRRRDDVNDRRLLACSSVEEFVTSITAPPHVYQRNRLF